MPLLERGIRGISLRARKEARSIVPQTPERQQPIYSEAFLAQQVKQHERDARMAAIVPAQVTEHIGFGQDRDVALLVTAEGNEYVAKTLKTSSRPYMVFGFGIPAGEIPCDTDISGKRERLVNEHSHMSVNPYAVAEKLRLTHILADTYLDRGDGLILPTATVVVGNEVQDRQRYIPRIETPPGIMKDPTELRIEEGEKIRLFRILQARWKEMVQTLDFRQMPADVQDYWRTFPPDSGYGTNARFLGVGNVLAIDY